MSLNARDIGCSDGDQGTSPACFLACFGNGFDCIRKLEQIAFDDKYLGVGNHGSQAGIEVDGG